MHLGIRHTRFQFETIREGQAIRTHEYLNYNLNISWVADVETEAVDPDWGGAA